MDRINSLTREISPYSWLVTIAFDFLWTPLEGLVTLSIVGLILVPILMILLFSLCAFCVTLIQHYSAKEDWGAALGKGVMLGAVAAVPLPVFTAALAILSAAVRRRSGIDGETIQLGQLTQAWREIEGLLRNALPYEQPNESIESVINRLYADGLLSISERDQLHFLRRKRNDAVHEGYDGDLSTLIASIQSLTYQLALRLPER